MSNPYEYCVSEGYNINNDSLVRCISTQIQDLNNSAADTNAVLFLTYSASLVFFMQAGFAMICSGSVRKKNVQNTMLKNLLDVCGAAVAFFTVGYAFAFGGSNRDEGKSFIGTSNFLLLNLEDDSGINHAYFLFQFAFAATSATIVAGTLAERCQMNAYLYYSMTLTGFVYPVVAHNLWSVNGFLSHTAADPFMGVGVIDFAGSGVVHVTGGFTALIATKLLGARKGRFYNDRGEKLEEPKTFPGHSKSLQMLGTFILWFGWFGFNAGSAIDDEKLTFNPTVVSLAVVNTTLSGATSGITALFTNLFISERRTGEPLYNLSAGMNGCLAGLAAVTGSCAVIQPWAAIVVGLVSGWIFLIASNLLQRCCLDDAVDAIPVHLACGAWGLLNVGLFASPTGLRNYLGVEPKHVGVFYSWGRGSSDATLLACQFTGLAFIIGWVIIIMLPFFMMLNYFGLLRSDSLEEVVGLDVSYHGWIPMIAEDVTQSDVDAYLRQQKFRSRHGSRHSNDEEQDNTGVDRFE